MQWKAIRAYSTVCAKWILLAVLCGAAVGPVGAVFAKTLDTSVSLRERMPWLLYLLPVGGLAVVFLYRRFPGAAEGSTNTVFLAVRKGKPISLVAAPLIFLATTLTQLLGGSAGREGAALQLGGSISSKLGRLLRLSDNDCRIMTMCGMAAAFSSVFGTPMTAALFSMEVTQVGVIYYAALVPCLLSALLGAWIAGEMGVTPHVYHLDETLALAPGSIGRVLLLGMLLALLSIFVCHSFRSVRILLSHWIKNPYLRITVGGVIIIAGTLILGNTDYNGAGMNVIHRAIDGEAAPLAFLLKTIFTALTIAAGFKGGEIVPVFFIGSTFGCVLGPVLGIPAGFAAALGMVGLFCGVTNSPIASLLLAIELFGSADIGLFAIICAVSYMLSGFCSLYSEQRFQFSKLTLENAE